MIKLEIQVQTKEELEKTLKDLCEDFWKDYMERYNALKRENIISTKVETREKENAVAQPTTNAAKFVDSLNSETEQVSIDECRNIYIQATKLGVDKSKIKQILTELEVDRITALPIVKRKEFVDKLKKLMGESNNA